jgi:uncharacterized protein YceK
MEADMQKLAIFLAATLLILSGSSSMAKHRKAVKGPYYHYYNPYYGVPPAERMGRAQQMWPNVALCDDGGYRIRPCDVGTGGRR